MKAIAVPNTEKYMTTKMTSVVVSAITEWFDLIYRQAAAAGIELAAASGVVRMALGRDGVSATHLSTPMRIITSLSLFAGLTDEVREGLASNVNRLTVRKGDTIRTPRKSADFIDDPSERRLSGRGG